MDHKLLLFSSLLLSIISILFTIPPLSYFITQLILKGVIQLRYCMIVLVAKHAQMLITTITTQQSRRQLLTSGPSTKETRCTTCFLACADLWVWQVAFTGIQTFMVQITRRRSGTTFSLYLFICSLSSSFCFVDTNLSKSSKTCILLMRRHEFVDSIL